MTLPTDIVFPLDPELLRAGDIDSAKKYNANLITSLTDMYQDIAQNVNGSIREWSPTVYGTGTAGTATYSRQFGWIRRAGILTELWMDIAWTAHTGAGSAAILMPYQAANSSGSPWIGTLESAQANTFGSGNTYLVWRCEPNTTQGSIIRCGSGVVSTSLPLAASGGFRGYIQYLGKEIEN